MVEGFDLEPETQVVMKLFGDTAEAFECNRDHESSVLRAVEYMFGLDQERMGMIVIDLMIIVGSLNSRILKAEVRAIEEAQQ